MSHGIRVWRGMFMWYATCTHPCGWERSAWTKSEIDAIAERHMEETCQQ